jgi:hypothetical protein
MRLSRNKIAAVRLDATEPEGYPPVTYFEARFRLLLGAGPERVPDNFLALGRSSDSIPLCPFSGIRTNSLKRENEKMSGQEGEGGGGGA